jgi:serine/threonine-protein kinase
VLDPPLASGDTLDRYRIEELLGAGGMGCVYRAHDPRLQRRIALKVIATPSGDPQAAELTARLLREARAAAALDHPHAVVVHDAGEAGGLAFIAMELVTGRTLRQCIGETAIPWPRRVRWLVEIASALAAAHRAGLIHRDVKPENVMIRDDGRAKVLDFGIARRLAGPVDPRAATVQGGIDTITLGGIAVGTPLYMAPEQLRSEPLDGRADQFSWGVVAFELLAGERPWGPRPDAVSLLAAILTEEPRRLGPRCPELPEPVERAVHRTLAKDPDGRFPGMDDVIRALEPFAAAGARLAPPSPAQTALVPAPPGPARAGWRRPALLALAAVTLAGAAAVAGWRILGGPGRPPPAGVPPLRTVAVTALPPPVTSAAALAAYRAGVGAHREGDWLRTREELRRALSLDAALAAAHVQLVVDAVFGDVDASAREHFRRADELRRGLSARDQALLDAVEPVVRRQPADWTAAQRRLSAALARHPGDAQLWFLQSTITLNAEGFAPALRAAERAAALDPGYAMALLHKAQIAAYLGRFDLARASLAQCLQAVPASVTCLREQARLEQQEGGCADVEATARRMITVDATGRYARHWLAAALAGQGALPALREAVQQKYLVVPDAIRRRNQPVDAAAIEILAGDFVAAERWAQAHEAAVETSDRQADHGRAARLTALILDESGRTREAGARARSFLDRRHAWEPDPRAEDFALAADVTPVLMGLAHRVGALSRDDLAAGREAWVRAWARKVIPDLRGYVWLHGFAAAAAAAESPDEARVALGALPRYAPIPPYRPGTLAEAAIGVTELLAGRPQEAVRQLTRATRTCRALEFPVEHTRASYWLGRAHEAAGDRPAACAAYAVVRARWGHARPRSVTAERAGARAAALGCRPAP